MTNWNTLSFLLCCTASSLAPLSTHAFVVLQPPQSGTNVRQTQRQRQTLRQGPILTAAASSTSTTSSTPSTPSTSSVAELKKVLEREYVSFFNPMRTEFYSPAVTFDDPLNNLAGVDAYKTNVDMLSGRTLLGSILFEDASINLHSVTGGEIDAETGSIADITTRWTLRFTMKALPWKPTTRFSGISVYQVKQKDRGRVQIVNQADYWDSINLLPGGTYEAVDKSLAFKDFLGQLKPGGFEARPAAPELPFSLLRRGTDYEVRRYPAYTTVQLPYERRDEGFGTLGAFTTGIESPLGPAIMTVVEDGQKKTMQWPLTFAPPGRTATAPDPIKAIQKKEDGQWDKCEIRNFPTKVVAVADFSDASMEPVVRKADRELRASLKRDGLIAVESDTESSNEVTFAQYDAIFSMGKRRGEVWIDLKDGGHPW